MMIETEHYGKKKLMKSKKFVIINIKRIFMNMKRETEKKVLSLNN